MGNEQSAPKAVDNEKRIDKTLEAKEGPEPASVGAPPPVFTSDGRRLAPGEVEYLRLLRPGEHVIPGSCRTISPTVSGPWDCRPMTGVVAQALDGGRSAAVYNVEPGNIHGSYAVVTARMADCVPIRGSHGITVRLFAVDSLPPVITTIGGAGAASSDCFEVTIRAESSTRCPKDAATTENCRLALDVVETLLGSGEGEARPVDLADPAVVCALPLVQDVLEGLAGSPHTDDGLSARAMALSEGLVEELVSMCVRASAEGWQEWSGHGTGVTSVLASRRWSTGLARRIAGWSVLARAAAIEVCIAAQDPSEGVLPPASVFEWAEGGAEGDAERGAEGAGGGGIEAEGGEEKHALSEAGVTRPARRYLERLCLGMLGALHQVIDTRWAATGRYLLSRMPMSPQGAAWAADQARVAAVGGNPAGLPAGGGGTSTAGGASGKEASLAEPAAGGRARSVPHPPSLAGESPPQATDEATAESSAPHPRGQAQQVWPPDYPAPGVPPWWKAPGGLPGAPVEVPQPPPAARLPSTMAWLEAYTRWNSATAGLARVWNTCVDPTLLLGGLESRRGLDVRRLRQELLQASLLLAKADDIEKESVNAATEEVRATAAATPAEATDATAASDPPHPPAPSADAIQRHRTRLVAALVDRPLPELQAASEGFRAGEMWNALPAGLAACRSPADARAKMRSLLEPVGPDDAPWQYVCVAGGLPLRAACPLPDPPEQEMKPDIDLWLLGDTAEQRTARARMVLAHLSRQMPDHIAVLSRALVRLQPTKPGHAEAQLMVPEARHSRGVTALFDVDMVRCAFDGKHFQATPDACMSYACRTVLTSLCPVRAKRALKALAKGFVFGPGVRWECPDLEGAYLCLGLPDDRWPTTEPVKARINKKGDLAADRPSRETQVTSSAVQAPTASGEQPAATACDPLATASAAPKAAGGGGGSAAADPAPGSNASDGEAASGGKESSPATPDRKAAESGTGGSTADGSASGARTSARYIKREFTSVREALRAVPGAVLAARLGARGAVLQIMRAFDPAPFERLSPGWRLGPELQALVLQARETMQAAMAARAGVQPSVTAGQWRRGGGMWLPRRGHAERRKHRQQMLQRLHKEFGGGKGGGAGKGEGEGDQDEEGAGRGTRYSSGDPTQADDGKDGEGSDGEGKGEKEGEEGDEAAVVQVSTHSELKDYEGRMEERKAFAKRGKGKDGTSEDQLGLDVGDEMTGYENQAVRSRRLDPAGVSGFPGRGDTRGVAMWQARRRVMPVLLQIVRVWYQPPAAGAPADGEGGRVRADADGGTLVLSARRSEQRGAFQCMYWLRQCLVLMAGEEEAKACVPVCPAELEEEDALLAAEREEEEGGGAGRVGEVGGGAAASGGGDAAATDEATEGIPPPAYDEATEGIPPPAYDEATEGIPPPAYDEARVVVDPGRSGSMLAVEAASPHAFVSGTSGPARVTKGRGLRFLHGKCARAFVVVVPGRKAFCLRLQLHSPHEIDLRQSVYGMERLVRYGAALRE